MLNMRARLMAAFLLCSRLSQGGEAERDVGSDLELDELHVPLMFCDINVASVRRARSGSLVSWRAPVRHTLLRSLHPATACLLLLSHAALRAPPTFAARRLQGTVERLAVYPEDEPTEVARRFAEKHSLSASIAHKLARMLAARLEAVVAENDEKSRRAVSAIASALRSHASDDEGDEGGGVVDGVPSALGTVVTAAAWAESAQRAEAEQRAEADDELAARRRRERIRQEMLQ